MPPQKERLYENIIFTGKKLNAIEVSLDELKNNMQIIRKEFIKKHYFDIIKTANGFAVKNTYRKENMIDRDDIEKIIFTCETLEEAEEYLEKLKKGIYKI